MIAKLLEPLRERRYAAKFVLVLLGLAALFGVSATTTSLLGLKPFPGISAGTVAFAAVKAFSQLQAIDYVFFALFPLLAALLWVHYEHARCVPNGESRKAGALGMLGVFFGFMTAACPLCLIPLLGLTASAAAIAPVTRGLKWAGVLLLLGALVFVMKKNACCVSRRNP
jgi:hypothetical protein